MTRNRRIKVGVIVAVIGVVGLVTVGSAFALTPQIRITISSSGFSPQVLRIGALSATPIWANTDSVAHTLTFADGCSVKIDPGAEANGPCGTFSQCAGEKSYLIDGFTGTTGKLVIVPLSRSITLHASSRSIKHGRTVSLSGKISYAIPSPPSPAARQQVIIRRMTGSAGFRVVARVMSTGGFQSTWHARLKPSATAVYRVEISAQRQPGCVLWANAHSQRLKISVR